MSERMAYVAIHECGRVVAACVDEPAHKKETAKEVARWLKYEDCVVERRTVASVQEGEWCDCFSKARALLASHGQVPA